MDTVASLVLQFTFKAVVTAIVFWLALLLGSRISLLTPRKRDLLLVSAIAAVIVEITTFIDPWLSRVAQLGVYFGASAFAFVLSLFLLRRLCGLDTVGALRVGFVSALFYTLATVALAGVL